MANILTGDAIYVSVQDVRDTVTNPAILALTDAAIQSLIYQSQLTIDTYLKHTYWCKSECDQEFLFPIKSTDCDWLETELIPKDISIATIYVLEYIFDNWQDMSAWWKDITQEKTWPHSVTFGKSERASDGLSMPQVAIALLRKWKNTFYRQEV